MTVGITRIIISMVTKILLDPHSQRTIRSHIQANFQNTRERLQERHYLLLQVGPLQRGRRTVQRHYRPPTHEIAWLRSTARLSQLQLLQSADTSPTPGRFYDRTSLYGNGESDLATAILELLRSDNLKLKASTEVQVRHEIGLALDVGETKLRRYEETIQNFVGALRNLRQPFRSLQHRMRYLRWNETFSVTLPIENCSAKSPAPCPPLFYDLNTKPWPTLVQITTCKKRFAGFYEFQTSCHISLTTFHGVGRWPASACHRQCIGIILIRQ